MYYNNRYPPMNLSLTALIFSCIMVALIAGENLRNTDMMHRQLWWSPFHTYKSEQPSERQLWSSFEPDYSEGQSPQNFRELGGSRYSMKVAPYEESVKVHTTDYYTSGKFEVSLKSASETPGVITALFLVSSDDVQRSDTAVGSQDEIDFEFIGNDLTHAHTNIFLDGDQTAELIDLGFDHSKSENTYAIEWDNNGVKYFINGAQVRYVKLDRPLKPMRANLAVWTTTGGWEGLQQWAGTADWNGRDGMPVEATFTVLSLPNQM